MVVATFKDGVTPEDIRTLIPAEQAQAKVLGERGMRYRERWSALFTCHVATVNQRCDKPPSLI